VDDLGIPIIRRRRLVERLHELVHRRLVLVVAPAGYGKTTLLSDFAADCAAANVALTFCRYAVSPEDGDGIAVLRGVATAFSTEISGAGDRTLRLLDTAGTGRSSAEAQGVVASAIGVLVGDVQARVSEYTLLVIDDSHLLEESDGARAVLEALLDRLPGHVHIALVSRVVPSIDTSRLVIEGQVGALGPRDLAFDDEELSLFLGQRYGLEVEPGVLEEIQRWTEGWITGLILAMPSLPFDAAGETTSSPRIAALLSTLAGARRGGAPLHEYLAGALVERLAPEDSALLFAASLADICACEQLDAVLGRTDSWHVLARLERAGVPLTREPGPYRYRIHALLQHYLRAAFERSNPTHYWTVQRRWAEVAAQHADPAAAVRHAISAHWWMGAVDLIEAHGERWVDLGRGDFVREILAALPPDAVVDRPRIVLCSARLEHMNGHYNFAVERARQSFFGALRRKDRATQARALVLEALASLAGGRSEEGIELCQQALAQDIVLEDAALLAEACRALGTIEVVRGMHARATEHLEKALALYEELGNTWETAGILNNLGVALEELGQPATAERCHARSLALRRDLGDLVGQGRSLANLAILRFHAGALEEAERLYREAISLADRADQGGAVPGWYFCLGDLCRVLGRSTEAMECYRVARTNATQWVDPRWQGLALCGVGSLLLLDDDIAGAERAAREALDEASRSGMRAVEGHAHVRSRVRY
jgi:LuxR family transcriptional regulator, maltose regulon positive regulatory protein